MQTRAGGRWRNIIAALSGMLLIALRNGISEMDN
jgi:hypothetical protein